MYAIRSYYGCEALDAMKRLNLFSDRKEDFSGLSFGEMTARVAGVSETGYLKEILSEKLNVPVESTPIKALEWLGLLSPMLLSRGFESPFEIVSDLMLERMELLPDERDMVVMKHLFKVVYPGGKRKSIECRLLDFGVPAGDTSIARTVALPAAISYNFV